MDPDGVERRLAAILHGDMAGYSRLMAEHEDSTVRLQGAYRDEIDLLIGQHGGRMVDFTGDELLAEFSSAIEAVRCALEIQSVLRARNARIPEGQRVEFRTGVHAGEVRVEGERLYDIFEIQDEITEAIANAIGFEVGRAEMDRAMRTTSRNLDAWETAHRAAWHFQRMNKADMARARELFTEVTELDPRWVWPYQALVMTHSTC